MCSLTIECVKARAKVISADSAEVKKSFFFEVLDVGPFFGYEIFFGYEVFFVGYEVFFWV